MSPPAFDVASATARSVSGSIDQPTPANPEASRRVLPPDVTAAEGKAPTSLRALGDSCLLQAFVHKAIAVTAETSVRRWFMGLLVQQNGSVLRLSYLRQRKLNLEAGRLEVPVYPLQTRAIAHVLAARAGPARLGASRPYFKERVPALGNWPVVFILKSDRS